ncbi:MAG: hypothetical protein U0K26_09375 [Prevotella pectinovora]|uniref:hypothetical protein n=1 Tax=Prevotella pectinovora TaxID=1602169 RepID=UPI002E7624CA|nr:hypothetical protein [Prevotella pectinovora]MEE1547434.1 hypothetical protein [Prevotella pectinovora]
MATFNKKHSTVAAPEYDDRPKLNINGATVSGCRFLSDKVIAFTLNLPGLALYNMKVIDGKNGAFVSPPQNKSKKSDRWVDAVGIWLDSADEDEIAQTVINHATQAGDPVDWKTRHEV